jgi:Ca2+-binding EF-hand superfamily protein
MKKILTMLTLAAAAAVSLPAGAAEPGANPPKATAPETGSSDVPPIFRALDQDKDGQISKDESKRSADVQGRFEAMDADHSGKISLTEWSAAEKSKDKPKS